MLKQSLGELIGTFILVFIGCSSVAISTLGIGLSSLLEVAIIWGIGVALAIYSVRKFCPAHLNPAVSLSLYLEKKICATTLLSFILFQFMGAVIAGLLVFILFNSQLIEFEHANGIIRGTINSRESARMFGEYFKTGNWYGKYGDLVNAMYAEAKGTFVLVFVILIIGKTRRKIGNIAPLLIGLTITLLILWIAPDTQGGFNPARDFGPRLVAYFGGWKDAAFPPIPYSFFTVYILAPFIGGTLASLIFNLYRRYSKN
ncbi:aquaporin family protein [bacterium]|jgi:glycerol uptake facilitator protein|nr:aquaporin family protein [bacterium]